MTTTTNDLPQRDANMGAPTGGGAKQQASGAMVDPTANVLLLVEAAVKRQDDLLRASEARQDDLRTASQSGSAAILELGEKWITNDLRHLTDVAELRAAHAREINALESNRLNAIRQVDVLAVATAADRAQAAIATLAQQTTTNADTLRNLVTSSAAALATQQANTVAQITERISNLEKSMYEIRGKSAYADPQTVELLAEVKRLREQTATGTGKSEGGTAIWGFIVAGVGLVAALIAIFFALSKGGP